MSAAYVRMQIALLSAGTGWHVRDLQRAAAELGHATTVLDFRRVKAGVEAEDGCFAGLEAVVVRTMPPGSLEQVVFRMDVLHRLHERKVRVLNPPRALEICVDKYVATTRLESAGLPVPPTIVCQHAEAALEAFDALGGDVVVKPLFGAEGRGLVRVSDKEVAWRIFQAIERSQSVLYLQRYVDHPGWDLRVFVLGGRVLASMRRYARDGWRTNVAQGATAKPIELTQDEEQLAIRAADAVDTSAAGVDLLCGRDGKWYVLEVNAVPGWRALSAVTNVDVARALVRYLADEYRSK
jgi:ribosomal protein S6--L-glutamate ligase